MKKVYLCGLLIGANLLSACTSFTPSAGPSAAKVMSRSGIESIQVVDVSQAVVEAIHKHSVFIADKIDFSSDVKPSLPLGQGDGIQVSIWEAPPAVLLSTSNTIGSDLSIGLTGGVLNLPEQMINARGMVTIPFVGEVRAAGRSLTEVEQSIRSGLSKIANQPQVVVRLVQNTNNTVSVVMEGRPQKLPLTAKGERLLDVLPLISDVKKAKDISLRLSRAGRIFVVSLKELSMSPKLNVYLKPADVVSVVQDAYTVTMLGATNANVMISFGAEGLSVAESLGKSAGLNGWRANPKGVFVFRQRISEDSVREPMVYRLDMSSANGIYLAQQFSLQDKDVVYVADSSSVSVQKVLSVIGSVVSPFAGVASTVNTISDLP